MTSIGDLFNHFMTLIGLKYYNKTESDNKYALKSEIPSDLTVDSSLSSNSTNPVQNKIVKGALDGKASSSHTHGNLTNDGNIGSVSGKVVTTTTNGVLTVSNWETEVNTLIEQLITYGSNNSSISLTVDNPILSYVDSTQQNPQVATLTAQLMDDEEADLSGVSVQFSIVDSQGNVLSVIGSSDTDVNGMASVTYTSQGSGDILVDASVDNRMFVSTTYTIEDFSKKYSLDSNTQYTNNSGGYGTTNISNGIYCGGSSFLSETFDGSSDWTVRMSILFKSGGTGVGIQYGVAHNRERSIIKINGGGAIGYNNSPNGWHTIGNFPNVTYNEWIPVEFIKKGNIITCYCNNTEFSTSNWEFTNNSKLSVGTDQWSGSGSNVCFKDLRILLG